MATRICICICYVIRNTLDVLRVSLSVTRIDLYPDYPRSRGSVRNVLREVCLSDHFLYVVGVVSTDVFRFFVPFIFLHAYLYKRVVVVLEEK